MLVINSKEHEVYRSVIDGGTEKAIGYLVEIEGRSMSVIPNRDDEGVFLSIFDVKTGYAIGRIQLSMIDAMELVLDPDGTKSVLVRNMETFQKHFTKEFVAEIEEELKDKPTVPEPIEIEDVKTYMEKENLL